MPLPLVPWGVQDSSMHVIHHAVAVPALVSRINPEVVLEPLDVQRLWQAVAAHDVRHGGRFAATPSTLQWWDRPWSGDSPGQSRLLGAVDIAVDRPMRGQTSIPRAVVTVEGRTVGITPADVARTVLDLVDIHVDPMRVSAPSAPPVDPFRSNHPSLIAL